MRTDRGCGPDVNAATKFTIKGWRQLRYRRFGAGSGHPLLLLQHFTGTLDRRNQP